MGRTEIHFKEDSKMKVLVAYDGTLQSKEALRYGMEKVRDNGGEVVALQVFNSPMFIDYDAHPGAEEMARRESALQAGEAKEILREAGTGIRARVIVTEGNPEEEIMDFARSNNVDILLCPPRYRSIIKRYTKLLGSQGKKTREDAVFDEAERLKMAVISMQ
jgi:nucleotide-binding universal stress UspA family protein